MLVRELIGIHYENRMICLQGRKGQVCRIDVNVSVQTAHHTSRKICVYNSLDLLIVLMHMTGLWTVKVFIIMRFIFRNFVSLVQ